MATTRPSVSLSGYSGFYGGATLTVSANTSYPFIYVGNALSGTYWRKATSGTTISIDPDTSSTSKTIYVFRSNTDLGASCDMTMTTSTARQYSVPRFACRVYYFSSSPTVCYWNETSGYVYPTDFGATNPDGVGVILGYSTKSYWTGDLSTYLELTLQKSSGPSLNGNTYYAFSDKSSTMKYYKGSSAYGTMRYDVYMYGKGLSVVELDGSEPDTTCDSDDSCSFLGWTTKSSSTTVMYDTLAEAVKSEVNNSSFEKIYGIYYKDESYESESVYYYRGSNSRRSVTKTTEIGSMYIYGTGSISGGEETTSYGSMTTTCLSNASYKLIGWTTDIGSINIEYQSAIDAFDAGNTTIYGIYYREKSVTTGEVYYYSGSNQKQSVEEIATRLDGYYYGNGLLQGGDIEYSHGEIHTECLSDSSYHLIGWTGNQASTTIEYESAEEAFDHYDIIYGIYKKDSFSSTDIYNYYLGGSNIKSVDKTTIYADAYYFGTGQKAGGDSSSSYGIISTDCDVSGWTFVGFATDENVQSSTLSAIDLFEAGNTTIYGTYSKDESMMYYPENGEESGSAHVTNYRYGINSVTLNYPDEPALTKEDYTQVGWGTTSGATTYNTWNTLWDNGTRTVYAIWVKNGNTYYGIDDQWILCDTYYGVNDVWVPIVLKYGENDNWN